MSIVFELIRCQGLKRSFKGLNQILMYYVRMRWELHMCLVLLFFLTFVIEFSFTSFSQFFIAFYRRLCAVCAVCAAFFSFVNIFAVATRFGWCEVILMMSIGFAYLLTCLVLTQPAMSLSPCVCISSVVLRWNAFSLQSVSVDAYLLLRVVNVYTLVTCIKFNASARAAQR